MEISYLTIPAFCARMGLSRAFIYKLIQQGMIGVVKVGKRTLVPAQELEDLPKRYAKVAIPSNNPEEAQ